jgi:hypothetical protein
MANPIDQPLPPPVNRTKGRAAEADPAPYAGREPGRARGVFDAPEFNALGPATQQGPRTIDEQRALDLGLAPEGSKDYVAGQPADAEEAARTEAMAQAKARAAGPDLVTSEGIKRAREQEGDI